MDALLTIISIYSLITNELMETKGADVFFSAPIFSQGKPQSQNLYVYLSIRHAL